MENSFSFKLSGIGVPQTISPLQKKATPLARIVKMDEKVIMCASHDHFGVFILLQLSMRERKSCLGNLYIFLQEMKGIFVKEFQA
jgi:hypothetical protein